jgi:hypothetical protein
MKICKELEQQFNLVPLKKGEREFEYPKAINYRDGDLKHKASNIIKATAANFHFQSFGEFRTMLERFNLTAEEVKGKHNGILYSVLDDKGNKTGRPFKSSLFGKEVGFEALQKHYETSKLAIENKNIREHLRPIIAEAMRKCNGNRKDFVKLIKEKRLDVIFRENDQKRIYGVTFIDYQNRAILNGSRLGKEFSANVFNDLFNNPDRQIDETKNNILNDALQQPEQTTQNTNTDFSLGSVLSLFDMPPPVNAGEDESVVDAEKRRKKRAQQIAPKKRGRGI